MISFNKRRTGIVIAICGLLLCTIGIFQYWQNGFQPRILWYWFFGLGLMSVFGFVFQPRSVKKLNRRDFLAAGLLALIFIPIYLYSVWDIPRQMNMDEIAIMTTAKEVATQPGVDLFGPSHYFGFPNLIFWIFGKLGILVGGVTLDHIRTLHAASGVLIIVLSFFLFRQLLARREALLASSVIGLNHSLFFISRMAMRDNTALLFEIVALTLLLYGWRKNHLGYTLLGGVASGLTFYTYYPSRITILIWAGFVTLFLILRRFKDWQRALRLSGVAIIGFMIMVIPLFIADSRAKDPIQKDFVKKAFLFTREGRQLEKSWTFAPDEATAVRTNIQQGLLAFNRPYHDMGYIYYHPGYGFVDKITGALIWIGLLTIVIGSIKKRRIKDGDILMVFGFLAVWLSLAFLITEAPNYTRLLVSLPFIGYLVARAASGMVAATALLVRRRLHHLIKGLVMAVVAALIALSNGMIIKDFIDKGKLDGNALGDTVRFQEQHSHEAAVWYFAPAAPTSYFFWGTNADWRYWLNFAKGEEQALEILTVNQLEDNDFAVLPSSYHGYLLTNDSVWSTVKSDFAINYAVAEQINLTPDGRLLVVKFSTR